MENTVNYIDGFVAAAPTANRDVYRRHAEQAAVVFKEPARSRWSSAGATTFPTAS
jgi:uncharacterized protein YbaA (DUF1428 family)